jgi:hypothetical protein
MADHFILLVHNNECSSITNPVYCCDVLVSQLETFLFIKYDRAEYDDMKMQLSPEAVIAIVGVAVTLPPSLLVLWSVKRRRNNAKLKLRGRGLLSTLRIFQSSPS